MRLANPLFLLLFIPLALVVWERLRATGKRSLPVPHATMRFSDLELARDLRPTSRAKLVNTPFWLRVIALGLLIFAASRPQYGMTRQEIVSKGVDIVLCLDQSGSMRGIDLEGRRAGIDPDNTRLNIAKQVIRDFVKGRRNDRLGLIVFAGRVYTKCPLTLDYGILLTLLDSVQIAERDSSTAIGDAIGTAVNHLKDSDAKSKVIILVTDGESNSGVIDPITAARLAAEYKIKVYTVGVGSKSGTVVIVKNFFGSQTVPQPWGLDEETLKQVAEITGATYFPAGGAEEMKEVFGKIDRMEKTDIKMQDYTDYSERFLPWAALAFGLLVFEVVLGSTYLRSVP